MSGRKILQTSLNTEDVFEEQLYEHAIKQGSVSRYLKRLIFLDMNNQLNQQNSVPKPPVIDEKKVAAMKQIKL